MLAEATLTRVIEPPIFEEIAWVWIKTHLTLRMIEIAPARLLPLATLLFIAMAAALAAGMVLAAWRLRVMAGRLAAAAAVVGLLLAVGSAVFRSSRGAGTGTHTAFGWPRAVYTRWVSWETPERIEGIRLRGIAENALFYATMTALAGSLGLAARRGSRAIK